MPKQQNTHNLASYLQEVRSHLSSLPPAVQQGELNEVESHLQQLIAEKAGQGYSQKEATHLAIAQFGQARQVGLQLRDVWEHNRGIWQVLGVVTAANWLFDAANIWIFFRVFASTFRNNQLATALEPFFWAWGISLLFLLPFLLNFVLGQWGGRRVALGAGLAYLPLIILGAPILSLRVLFGIGWVSLPISTPLTLTVAMAMTGAWLGAGWRRKQCFAPVATAGAISFNEAAAILRRPHPLRQRAIAAVPWLLTLSLLGTAGAAVVKHHIDSVLHPATPEAAVKVMLSAPGFNPGEMLPSTDVKVRLLPAQGPWEISGQERRVAYSAVMHAGQEYRQRRIAYLQRELKAAIKSSHPSWPPENFREAIGRLRPEGYHVKGIVRVVRKPDGWHVHDYSDGSSTPWSWLYDIGHRENNADK